MKKIAQRIIGLKSNIVLSIFLPAFTLVFFSQCSEPASEAGKSATPPKADKIPIELTAHGDTRIDNYYWMRLSDEQKSAEIQAFHLGLLCKSAQS